MNVPALLIAVALTLGSASPRPAERDHGPTPIERQLARADSTYFAGRDDEARAAYRVVLSLDPQSARAHHRLAVLLARIDRLDSALVHVGIARSLEPGDLGVLTTEARLLSWAGRYDASLADYESVLAVDPGQHEARLGRARVLAWEGRYASADSAYATLLAASPDDVEAMIGRAQVASWRGQTRLAEAQFLAATRLDHDNAEALIGLATLQHNQGRQRSAAASVSRVLEIDRDRRDANALLREIRAAQRPQVDLGVGYAHDSDHNDGWSRTVSASVALADGVRGFLTVGSLAASDPTRDANRELGEVGLDAARGNVQAVVAAGSRWLDASGGPRTSIASYRASLSGRVMDRISIGAGIAHYPLDETAMLIGRGLRVTELQTSLAAEIRRLSIDLSASGARLSDDNQRGSAVIALMHPLGRSATVGAFGRAMSYERRGIGYFSPDRFVLAEGRGNWSGAYHAWTVRLDGGLGAQQLGRGADPQLAWHATGQLAWSWSVINRIETTIGATNSAASSTTGAFRFVTAAVALRLGL